MAEMKTLTINGKTYTIADPDAAHIDDSSVGTTTWSSAKISNEIETKHNVAVIEGTAEGDLISLTDASDDNLRGLKLYGKTTQFTTTGKNLIAPVAISVDEGRNFVLVSNNTGMTLLAGTYTVHIDIVCNKICVRPFGTEEDLFVKYATNTLTFTLTETKNVFFLFYNETALPAGAENTIQLEVGSVATAYEPYTGGIPAPNPDFPQELVSPGASGLINTTVCGKNLFNNALPLSKSTGATITKTETGFKVSAKYDGGPYYGYIQILPYDVVAGKEFHFSMKVSSNTSNTSRPEIGICDFGCENRKMLFKPTSAANYTLNDIFPEEYRGQNKYLYMWVSATTSKDSVAGDYFQYDDVMLCIGDSTPYIPYVSGGTLTAQTPNGLPGIPVTSGGNYTDENGQQWICDEIDFVKEIYVKRINTKVFDGTEDFDVSGIGTDNAFFGYRLPANVKAHIVGHDCTSMCSHFQKANIATSTTTQGYLVRDMSNSDTTRVLFRPENAASMTEDTFKAWVAEQYNAGTPVTVQYRLATPIETPLSAEELEAYAALHTNKPNTTVYNDGGADMELRYNCDTETAVDNKVKKGVQLCAPVIVSEASGDVVSVSDASEYYLQGLSIYGKTTQNGTPTLDAPVELVSSGASGSIGVSMTGKNIFGGDALADRFVELSGATKDTEAGTITFAGSAVSGMVYFNNFKPNTQYTFILYGRNSGSSSTSTNVGISYTDGSPAQQLRFSTSGEDSYVVFTSAANKTLKVFGGWFSSGYTTLYYDRCGIFEGVLTEADFEPYKPTQTLTAQTPNGLPGIPVSSGGNYTDESGQQWKCDEMDFARGVYVQRVGVFVSDGTESWVLDTTNVFGYKKLSSIISQNRGLCSHFVQKWVGTGSLSNGEYTLRDAGYVYIKHTGYDTVDAFKAWLAEQYANGTPVTLHYQLATPIETALSAEEMAAFAALHTNKLNTTVYNDSNAGLKLSYAVDTKTYIDNKFAALAAAIVNNA